MDGIEAVTTMKLSVESVGLFRVTLRLVTPNTGPLGIKVTMPIDAAMDMVDRAKRRAKAKSLSGWAHRMVEVMVGFRDASESAWKVLEGYGVTLDKLEDVKMAIYEGSMTRREGWAYLGLPEAEFPG